MAAAMRRSIPAIVRASRTTTRATEAVKIRHNRQHANVRQGYRCLHTGSPGAVRPRGGRPRHVAAFAVGAGLISSFVAFGQLEALAEGPSSEKRTLDTATTKRGASNEDHRDLLSSQHLQVKKSWENPGVYAWGSNSGRVVAPDSADAVIKSARRIPFFDGILLRDLKLDRSFGAAIDDKGDLLQWGVAHSARESAPKVTLKGKDLGSIVLSRDRVLALARNGKVYSIPVSETDQASGSKAKEASWLPFWSGEPTISYRTLQPDGLSWGEKVSQISGGLEHVLLVTSKGRLFSAACATEDFPSKGQLGIPGLTWQNRPAGRYDSCHEVATLRGFDIVKAAAGDHHSLALDNQGRVFAFGDNSMGQLGLSPSAQPVMVDAPSLVPVHTLYKAKQAAGPPVATDVAAGGSNSFITVNVRPPTPTTERSSGRSTLGRITVDTFSCGQGIWGGLGNGRWTHIQGTPTKIKALSGLFEYDEATSRVLPIRVAYISTGSTHTCAVLDNATYLGAHERSSKNDTNWGADALWWGGNEHYQLGTGKRNNISLPMYISPLDMDAERDRGGDSGHRFQITPRKTVKFNGKTVSMEQRVECGRGVSAVYSSV